MDTGGDDFVARAIQGDLDALRSLLQRHGPSLRPVLAREIPKRWQALLSADDVLQQTYADAVVAITTLQSTREASFAAWLETTARNNLRDAIKMLEAEKRGGNCHQIHFEPGDGSVHTLWELLAQRSTTPSRVVARQEAVAALKKAIAELPDGYARVVTLYDIEQRPVGEVARIMERGEGAVFMLRNRAHERLRDILGRASKYFSTGA